MVRLRLASLSVAASLVLVSGCLNLSQHPWFAALRGRGSSADCCLSDVSCCDGPILGDAGPYMGTPVSQEAIMAPPLAPAPTQVPGLAPAPQPRLVPQPQQAQPEAFQPPR
jgi:hypothetical protein